MPWTRTRTIAKYCAEEKLGIQTYVLCPALNESQSLLPMATIALAGFRPEAKCGEAPSQPSESVEPNE